MPDSQPDELPEEGDDDVPGPDPEHRRRRLERVLPDVLTRALEKGLEAGLGTLANSGEALRGVRVPKEMVGYVFGQIDETKNLMVRVVAKEVRDFLAATDLSAELQRALTALSFEIRTEIRFIPNDKGGIRPEVKSEVEPKRREAEPKRGEAAEARRRERRDGAEPRRRRWWRNGESDAVGAPPPPAPEPARPPPPQAEAEPPRPESESEAAASPGADGEDTD